MQRIHLFAHQDGPAQDFRHGPPYSATVSILDFYEVCSIRNGYEPELGDVRTSTTIHEDIGLEDVNGFLGYPFV